MIILALIGGIVLWLGVGIATTFLITYISRTWIEESKTDPKITAKAMQENILALKVIAIIVPPLFYLLLIVGGGWEIVHNLFKYQDKLFQEEEKD